MERLLPWVGFLLTLGLLVLCYMSRKLRMGIILVIGKDGKVHTMSLNVNEGQSGTATVVFTDANGVSHPLAPGNIPVWAIDPPSAASLTPSTDGMSCDFVAGTTDGAANLTCTGEGDPVAGVDTIVASFALTVVAPEDTQGTISVTLK